MRTAVDDARALIDGVPSTRDEDRTMARAATRDPTAFAAIYERYRTPVYRYLRSRTASDDEAGELCAVTFERALNAINGFKPSGGGMIAWLMRIARNVHIDASRRSHRQIGRFNERPGDMSIGTESGPEDVTILRTLIRTLPPNQRDAIQLRFAGGLTAREIGAVLGMSESAAQKQLERALRALKEAYDVD
jgi:RNA polymerase sigma-70 factor (ECF subfamily)